MSTPPDKGVRSRRVNAPFFFPPTSEDLSAFAESEPESEPADDSRSELCRGKDSSAPTPDEEAGSANGFAGVAPRGEGAAFFEPAGTLPAGLLPDPCFTTAGLVLTPPPPGPGPDPASGVAASRNDDPSDTAPYHDVRWNPALVEAARASRRRVRFPPATPPAEPQAEPPARGDVSGVTEPATERGFAADFPASGVPTTPELEEVRPPVAVPALAVAGVSTARSRVWRTGEPGLGPADGLVRVGEEGRWLCPPGFAACARAARETTGRAGVGPVAGRTRAGARDPSLAPVHDADAQDAAIVASFKEALQKGFVSHAAREGGGPAGHARGERGDADAGLEEKRGVPEGRPTLVTFAARSADAECLAPSRRVDFKHGGDAKAVLAAISPREKAHVCEDAIGSRAEESQTKPEPPGISTNSSKMFFEASRKKSTLVKTNNAALCYRLHRWARLPSG